MTKLMIRLGMISSAMGAMAPVHWALRGLCLAGLLFGFRDHLEEILYDRNNQP